MDDELDEAIRRNRRGQLVGVAFLLIAVIVAVTIGFGGLTGDDPAKDASRIDGVVGTKETTALFRGVPQNGITLGDPNAPVTVVQFVDIKCPFCKSLELKDGPDIVRDLVRPGRANVELRILGNLGESSIAGRTAVHNLAGRGQVWTLAELLYFNQGPETTEWLTPRLLQRIGRVAPELRGIPLSMEPTAESRRLDVESEALRDKLGFDGRTPTIYVRPRGATDKAAFRKVDLKGTGSKVDKISAAVSDVSR